MVVGVESHRGGTVRLGVGLQVIELQRGRVSDLPQQSQACAALQVRVLVAPMSGGVVDVARRALLADAGNHAELVGNQHCVGIAAEATAYTGAVVDSKHRAAHTKL